MINNTNILRFQLEARNFDQIRSSIRIRNQSFNYRMLTIGNSSSIYIHSYPYLELLFEQRRITSKRSSNRCWEIYSTPGSLRTKSTTSDFSNSANKPDYGKIEKTRRKVKWKCWKKGRPGIRGGSFIALVSSFEYSQLRRTKGTTRCLARTITARINV